MKRSTYKLELYADMRVIVQRRGKMWEVWPQQFSDGKWLDHKGPAIAARADRCEALYIALSFSRSLLAQYNPKAAQPAKATKSRQE